MKVVVLVLAALVVVGGVGVGAFVAGRASVKNKAVSPTTSEPTSASSAPMPTTQAGPGGTVSLSDSSGDSLSVMLENVVNPDSADASGSDCGSDYQLVAVVISLMNTGSSVLTSQSVSAGLTVVASNSGPFSAADNVCGPSPPNSNNAVADCINTSDSIDLAPGASTTDCPVVALPISDTAAQIQFNASKADLLGPTGNTVAIWTVNGS